MQLGYYEFANNGDLILLGVVALILVVRNWWDIIYYGFSRHAASAAVPGSRFGRAGVRRVVGAVRRLRRRGKPAYRPFGHRHA